MNLSIRGFFDDHIASVEFNENSFRIKRAAFGFTIEILISIYFGKLHNERLRPVLKNLRGGITAKDKSGESFVVGDVAQPEFQEEYRLSRNGTESSVFWSGSLANLALFEKIRDGGVPEIELSVHGELAYLFKTQEMENIRLHTESRTFWLNSLISFPKETWVKKLRTFGVLENILVEIPLPSSPPAPWDKVWKAFIEARQSFEQGGSTAWKNCVVSSRLALELWQKIEKEDMGAGWKSPSPPDRQSRTKEQRLDNIRWHLLQYAHYSAHSHADMWTRKDALLMLTMLSTLLAKREP